MTTPDEVINQFAAGLRSGVRLDGGKNFVTTPSGLEIEFKLSGNQIISFFPSQGNF